MEQIQYRPWKESDQAALKAFIRNMYTDEAGTCHISDQHILRTFQRFTHHPDSGTILVFEHQHQLIGYAILVYFWSNEYGGMILYIDELYVVPEFRRRGVGTDCIAYLSKNQFYPCVGLKLEVLPYNTRALQLYEKLGFEKSDRTYLLLKT